MDDHRIVALTHDVFSRLLTLNGGKKIEGSWNAYVPFDAARNAIQDDDADEESYRARVREAPLVFSVLKNGPRFGEYDCALFTHESIEQFLKTLDPGYRDYFPVELSAGWWGKLKMRVTADHCPLELRGKTLAFPFVAGR